MHLVACRHATRWGYRCFNFQIQVSCPAWAGTGCNMCNFGVFLVNLAYAPVLHCNLMAVTLQRT